MQHPLELPARPLCPTSQTVAGESSRPLQVQGSMRRAAEMGALSQARHDQRMQRRPLGITSATWVTTLWPAISCQISICRVALTPEMAQGGQEDS